MEGKGAIYVVDRKNSIMGRNDRAPVSEAERESVLKSNSAALEDDDLPPAAKLLSQADSVSDAGHDGAGRLQHQLNQHS
jgi:hypothetical protein